MELHLILGFSAALFIGITLGLIGGGGSTLTLPVLVYVLGIDPILATAYSLFVVGSTSLVGAISYLNKKLVDYKAALVFSIPSFTAVFLTRKFLVPSLPDPLLHVGEFAVSKNLGIMIFFACIMLAASVAMIRNPKPRNEGEAGKPQFNFPLIAGEGVIVGLITGVVGAGGGFLIIPALVILAKLPMKIAVGTSLVIIAAKSLIGFLGDLSTQNIDWPFLLLFTLISILGIFIGSTLSKSLDEKILKTAFGWFVLLMGISIIAMELSAV